jgi:3-phenylpropionate/trans-cinnamate dioxygenase ferredoxin reductase subunit
VPWFWSDQGSLKLQIAGLGVVNTHNVARTTPGANGQSLYRFSADRLVAVESINRPADHITARQLLSAGLHPTPEQVADPQFDLRGLVKKASAADSASA